MLKSLRRIRPLASLVIFGLAAAAEQHGRVQFGGLPVPGATITAAQGQKTFVAVTDQQGVYSFPDLPAGTWTMRVEMLCFSTITRDVTVGAGADSIPEWELKLLPFDQIKAEVIARPAQTAVAVAQESKPAESKAPVKPNETTPAASEAADEFSQRPADGFLINGSINNGASSPFALAPAFGNFRKGPRGLYNGGIGFTLDNSVLDARSFSLTGQDTPKPAYNRLTGLLSFGGPFKIPHLVRNGPNFVLNYQWTRNRNATTQSSLVPTAAERAGDFGQSRPIFDPVTGLPFPGNTIAPSRFSKQATALLSFYPLPNFDGGARYNFQIPLIGIVHQDNLQSRFNQTINSNNQISGAFAYQSTRADGTNLFGFLDNTNTFGLGTGVNWRHTFTSRLYGNLGYQYSRLAVRSTPYFENRENVSAAAGISGNNQDALNWGPPNLTFSSGIAGLADAQQSFNRNQTNALSYAMLWNHASHSFSFGGDIRRQQFNYLSQQDPRGSFTFNGASTQAVVNGVPVPGTGSDFAGFLLGVPDTSSIAFGNADKYFRAWFNDAFFNDDWRVSPGLTINAGVRWEYGSPITELYGRLVNLDIAPGFAAVAPVVAAHPTGALTGTRYPDSLVRPDKHAFQPRIGLSWRPFAASSMVVRAGYGVYYNTSVYQSIATQMAQQSPLSKSLSVQNTPSNPLTLANGFNAASSSAPNTFAIDPDFRVGYTQNWQLSVQRDLPGALVMTATYLGIKGTRGMQEFLPNTFPIGAVNPCPACPAGYAYLASNGNSTRESGQIQLRRRLHNGVTATVQYAFSKAIDDSALGGRGQIASVIAQNWLDLAGERGLSSFDQRHLLTVQAQYSTGMGFGGGTLLSGWKGTALKEWTFTTQITAGSGFPLTPIYAAAVVGTGVTGSIRPDYTGATVYAAPPGLFLNPAAYTAPAPGQWGNAGRNSITGPGQFALSASMGRTFRLSDRLNLDMRVDALNALNHVTYQSWITGVTSSQFGLPTAANAMRSMQATVRVRF